MTRIGVTGHQDLPNGAIDYLTEGIRDVLDGYDHVEGYSCLAAGADQLFAVEALAAGGRLHVVIPCDDYTTTLDGDATAPLQRTSRIGVRHYPGCHLHAPERTRMKRRANDRRRKPICWLPVWDGLPARGRGGTADTVAYARKLAREVRVIWPSGMTR